MTYDDIYLRSLTIRVGVLQGRFVRKSASRPLHFFPTSCFCGRKAWVSGPTVRLVTLCRACGGGYGWHSQIGIKMETPEGLAESREVLEAQADLLGVDPLRATLFASFMLERGRSFESAAQSFVPLSITETYELLP